MGMVDNLSTPMNNASNNINNSVSKLDGMSAAFGGMTQGGVAIAALGTQITDAVLSPVEATFDTRRALGELASLGIQDLEALEKSATEFSNTWAGTTKSDFITAAYDIKSGIASLSDEGVAQFTELSGVTAKATKSTIGEMTDLFATGYGIYKDYYSDMSDLDFGEMFSAGISSSVQSFKTTGSGMANAIKTLGASATTAQVPLEEQLSILGMLQATMSGSEAGTKYKAFLKSAVKGGETLGLSFTDANNQLLSMPEIMELLKGKFGETMDAAEKMELQNAFGDAEAVALIDLFYNKTGDLQDNILSLYDSMGSGIGKATEMANAINQTEPEKFAVLKQKIDNAKESLGNSLLPTVNTYMAKAEGVINKTTDWINNNQELVRIIMSILLALGIMLTVVGGTIAIIGGLGLAITKTIKYAGSFINTVKKIPTLLNTVKLKALGAGQGISKTFSTIKTGAKYAITSIKNVVTQMLKFAKTVAVNAITAAKNFIISMAGMAKQAITTAVTAMPGLIASVWSFTAALLANPITWVIIGIVALIAAIILLWQNWESVTNFISGIVSGFVDMVTNGFSWVKEKIESLPAGFQAVLAVLFPFISIPFAIISNWGSIVDFFKSLPEKIAHGFQTAVEKIKNFFGQLPEFFMQSGARVLSAFAQGVTSALGKPVEAVKGALKKVRNLLPFSDAKEGPLSTLTLSGNRVLETITTGINQKSELPAQAVDTAFQKVDFNFNENGLLDTLETMDIGSDFELDLPSQDYDTDFENYGLDITKYKPSKVDLNNSSSPDYSDNMFGNMGIDGGKKVIIEKLMMTVDFNKIKDIKKLLKLIEEIEDYTNGNGEEGEPEPA